MGARDKVQINIQSTYVKPYFTQYLPPIQGFSVLESIGSLTDYMTWYIYLSSTYKDTLVF